MGTARLHRYKRPGETVGPFCTSLFCHGMLVLLLWTSSSLDATVGEEALLDVLWLSPSSAAQPSGGTVEAAASPPDARQQPERRAEPTPDAGDEQDAPASAPEPEAGGGEPESTGAPADDDGTPMALPAPLPASGKKPQLKAPAPSTSPGRSTVSHQASPPKSGPVAAEAALPPVAAKAAPITPAHQEPQAGTAGIPTLQPQRAAQALPWTDKMGGVPEQSPPVAKKPRPAVAQDERRPTAVQVAARQEIPERQPVAAPPRVTAPLPAPRVTAPLPAPRQLALPVRQQQARAMPQPPAPSKVTPAGTSSIVRDTARTGAQSVAPPAAGSAALATPHATATRESAARGSAAGAARVDQKAIPSEKPPETRGIVVTSLHGDLKMVMEGDGIRLSVVFREFPKARRNRAPTRAEARRAQQVVPLFGTRAGTREAVIKTAQEGIYLFSAEPEEGKSARAVFTLRIFENGGKEKVVALGTRTVTGKVTLARVLMLEGLLWDDDSAFTGSLEDSESVTKFNAQTGLYWKEYND